MPRTHRTHRSRPRVFTCRPIPASPPNAFAREKSCSATTQKPIRASIWQAAAGWARVRSWLPRFVISAERLGLFEVLSSTPYAFDYRDVATMQLLSSVMVAAMTRLSSSACAAKVAGVAAERRIASSTGPWFGPEALRSPAATLRPPCSSRQVTVAIHHFDTFCHMSFRV